MSEQLVSRVKRLVSGGVNSIVDAVENATPEMVMNEAIREVDSAIDAVRDEMGRVVASKHLASRRLMDANTKHETLAGQIATALDEGRDDLAEAAISKQMDLESQIPVLESAVSDAASEEAELERYLEALQARRREMEEELAAFKDTRAASETVTADGEVAASGSAERKVSKAERAFDRVMRNATGVPGSPGSSRGDAAKLAELEQLSRANRIKERLAAAKASQTEEEK
jgi:phage shock protein A